MKMSAQWSRVVKKNPSKRVLKIKIQSIITPLYVYIVCLPVGYLVWFWFSVLVKGMSELENTWKRTIKTLKGEKRGLVKCMKQVTWAGVRNERPPRSQLLWRKWMQIHHSLFLPTTGIRKKHWLKVEELNSKQTKWVGSYRRGNIFMKLLTKGCLVVKA